MSLYVYVKSIGKILLGQKKLTSDQFLYPPIKAFSIYVQMSFLSIGSSTFDSSVEFSA